MLPFDVSLIFSGLPPSSHTSGLQRLVGKYLTKDTVFSARKALRDADGSLFILFFHNSDMKSSTESHLKQNKQEVSVSGSENSVYMFTLSCLLSK